MSTPKRKRIRRDFFRRGVWRIVNSEFDYGISVTKLATCLVVAARSVEVKR